MAQDKQKTYPARQVTQTAYEADGKTVRHEVGDILPMDADLDNDVITQLVEVDTDPAGLDHPGVLREEAQAQKMNTGDDAEPADMAGAENTGGDPVPPGDHVPGGPAGGGRIAVLGQSSTVSVDGDDGSGDDDDSGGAESDSAGPAGGGGSSAASTSGGSTASGSGSRSTTPGGGPGGAGSGAGPKAAASGTGKTPRGSGGKG